MCASLTYLAAQSMSARWTDACVATNAIDAGGTALTGLRRTFVHIDATVGTGEALGAEAAKPAGTGLTGATIVARLAAALVNGLGAEQARPAGRAAAVRLQRLVGGAGHAGAAVLALTRIAAGGAFRAAFACARRRERESKTKDLGNELGAGSTLHMRA